MARSFSANVESLLTARRKRPEPAEFRDLVVRVYRSALRATRDVGLCGWCRGGVR